MNKENLWNDDETGAEEYISGEFDQIMLTEVQIALGYKLPSSYIELMREHNGGLLKRNLFVYGDAEKGEFVFVNGMFGIGREKEYSLCGEMGSKFWIKEWEYPNRGVAICDCPYGGHEMIFLDYRDCVKLDEPKVVHINQEDDYKITVLANSFEEFINGLTTGEELGDDFWDNI